MKQILLILIIFTSIFKVYSQENELFVGKILNDSTSFNNIPKHQKHLNPLLKSNNKIEIRFIKSPSFSPTEYFILKYNENWKLERLYFDTSSKQYSSISVEPQLNLDSLFDQLVNHRIFSLYDADSINYDEYNTVYRIDENDFVGFGGAVSDGTVYSIEYKVGRCYRRYTYFNPEYFLEVYKLVPDLKDMVEIINIFKNLN